MLGFGGVQLEDICQYTILPTLPGLGDGVIHNQDGGGGVAEQRHAFRMVQALAVALQADGRILVAGFGEGDSDPCSQFLLARFLDA